MTTTMKPTGPRFYYAFTPFLALDTMKDCVDAGCLVAYFTGVEDARFESMISHNEKTKGISDRIFCAGSLDRDEDVRELINACSKPDAATWSSFYEDNDAGPFYGEFLTRRDAEPIRLLVLVSAPWRSKNLNRLLSEAPKLKIVSTTSFQVLRKWGEGEGQTEKLTDTQYLYGRPPLPDWKGMSDAEHERYVRNGIDDIDQLIPVWEFDVQSFTHKQVLNAPIEPRAPLVMLSDAPMLWTESINEIFAWRSTGKTLLSLALGYHLAAGSNLCNLTIPNAVKVLYVEGELPKSQLQERMRQLSEGLTFPSENFTLISKSLQSHDRDQAAVTIKTDAGRQAIESHLEKTGAKVLILDSIASLAQISTNNEEAWLPIIEWMVELRCRGICVIYLQQAGKNGEQRGHSVSEDRIDLAVRLTKTGANPQGAAFTMSFTKEREGVLKPASLRCTAGKWEIDRVTAEDPKKRKEPKKQQILEALAAGVTTRSVAKRFKTSLRTISQIKKEKTDDAPHAANGPYLQGTNDQLQ
jgi:DNA-binding NarL/FixJ family response regulator